MTTIPAADIEIRIRDGIWELLPSGDTLSTRPLFRVLRGSGVMEYTPAFGASHKLPGTVLSIEYIRSVVVGYEKKSQCWLLGFQMARSATEKVRWMELVSWPSGDNTLYAASAQQAGRALAEYVGCPLKIFGAKKFVQQSDSSPGRSGVTGPLVPHKREDIGPQQVKLMAQSVKLPLEYPNMWLGHARSGVTLRLAKEASEKKHGGVTPSFNQCVIDPKDGAIRLLPPTGLLGTFFGGQQGRVVKTHEVRNVELRHSVTHEYVPQQEGSGVITEVTYTIHSWDIYLTLPDESLLLAQTSHTTSSELTRHRAMAGNKFAVDTEAGIAYLRKHQADQEAYDTAIGWADGAAMVIASALGVRLVKTEIDNNSSA
ncbi:MAG: hypothetical protein JW966_00890 [Anaerolineae bacterium]|nr:hypothetical protein [Anaerolineae bacterium]